MRNESLVLAGMLFGVARCAVVRLDKLRGAVMLELNWEEGLMRVRRLARARSGRDAILSSSQWSGLVTEEAEL